MTRFKFFNNINSLEQLSKEYKRLLKLHHPDNGGTKEASQTINNEYEALFKILKDRHNSKEAAEKLIQWMTFALNMEVQK